MATSKEDLARGTLELFIQIEDLKKQLETRKDELRDLANGNKLEVSVQGLGLINVSTPRSGSEAIVLVFDEGQLNKIPELRAKLIEKGVAKEEIKKTPAAKASVTIKPNV